MYRAGQAQSDGKSVYVGKILLDTGASSGSYVGRSLVNRFPNLPIEPCTHKVRLGDNKTEVEINQMVTLDVALYDEDDKLCGSIATEFYVMPDLDYEVIIGLPEILGNYYDYFVGVLEQARRGERKERVQRLHQLYDLCKDELCKPTSSRKKLRAFRRLNNINNK